MPRGYARDSTTAPHDRDDADEPSADPRSVAALAALIIAAAIYASAFQCTNTRSVTCATSSTAVAPLG